jgi:hypothetical protein
MSRDKSFFDGLQEEKSEKEYGTLLGRLICFYIRFMELEDTNAEDARVEWFRMHPLKESQVDKLRELKYLLDSELNESNGEAELELNDKFHEALMELFCWRD